MADEREGADITAADMITTDEPPTAIQQFYSNSSIFITGTSGFLGQLLVEKLFRSCPNVAHIYVLMRAKRGKTVAERFETTFNDVLFDRLHLEQPKFYERLSIIEGDLEQRNLGVKDSDLELLRSKIEIVFHVAATVRFDEKLRKAVNINVKSTRDMLNIAKTMPQLRAFVYVSTAYSNCIHQQVKETFYETPLTYEKLINICDTLDDPLLDHTTPLILGKWPNTYAFTKAIAENVVQTNADNLPLTIVRPSIVISTSKEPVSGWTNNYYGPVGVSIGSGLGLMHVLQCNPNYIADVIPADYVINTLIAAAWQIGTIQSDNLNKENVNDIPQFKDIVCDNRIPIYNNVSSCQNPITWQKYSDLASQHGLKYPSPLCIWYYHLVLTKNKYVYMICVLFAHLIPALIADGVCLCIGKKPIMLKAYDKIHKFSNVLTYFTCKQWNFQNQNTQALWAKLSKGDRRLFDFDIGGLDWNAYFYTFIRGARVYLLKDPLDTLPQARARHFKLKMAHYTLLSLVALCLFKCVVIVFRFLI